MGVDFHWRRVPEQVLSTMSPRGLSALIPSRYDEEYERLVQRGCS
ncbi:hypothetical protein [Embleya sp. MST-111070]